MQEGWSRFLGVTLLASNYYLPANGQIGSGIYNSAGAINFTASPDSSTRLVVARVGSNGNITVHTDSDFPVSKSTVKINLNPSNIKILFDDYKNIV